VTPIRPESAVPRTFELALLGNRTLQTLIRGNFVCFPAQAPVFGQKSRRDLQWRLAVLYFVRGWSTRSIADRYGLTRERCGQIISDWRIRAVALGYIQDVTPEGTDLSRLAEAQAAVPSARPQADANGVSHAAVMSPKHVSPPHAATTMPAGHAATGASCDHAATAVSSGHAATAVSENNRMSQSSFAISSTPRLPSTLR